VKNLKIFKNYHVGLIFTLFLYLLLTLNTYKDYPITADEEFRYSRGKELLNFYLYSQPRQNFFEPKILPDQFYFYNLTQNLINPNFYYEWFHFQNLLFGSIVFVSIYLLVFTYTKNQIFSTIGIFLIFLTPNFAGHLASNPVDMPFAVLFLANLYLIYYFRDKGFEISKILILGLSFWLLIGIRPLGFQVFGLYIIFSLLYKFKEWNYFFIQLKTLLLVGIVSMFLLTITWPYLGINLFKNLYFTFTTTAAFDNWNNLILYNGNLITKNERNWEFLFTYIIFTTPVYILFLLPIFFINFKNVLKRFLVITLTLNLLLYLAINPVIYNGLRHFLYLIPIIVTISLFNLYDILISKIKTLYKIWLITLITLNLIYIPHQTFKLYPLHYTYFNELAGGLENNILKYETDYWGGSYKKAAEYLRNNLATGDPYDLKVYSCNVSFAMDYY